MAMRNCACGKDSRISCAGDTFLRRYYTVYGFNRNAKLPNFFYFLLTHSAICHYLCTVNACCQNIVFRTDFPRVFR